MTERKEKTMLKWLKQKPTHGHGGLIEKITDDPLATIQVQPHAKKSKNKANEIYAVSRVNPLFEEEDVKEVFSPGGNSGSSGYDSGSGPSDDDFPIITNVTAELKDLQASIVGRLSSHNALLSNHASISAKHPQLFINTENDVIHHEAAIVGPNGRPILQILEQNPNYVKSIALQVANNGKKRPLSPISESSQQQSNNTHVLQRPSSSALAKYPPNSGTTGVEVHKDAKTNHTTSSVDSIGSARLITKDSQYVRSIRIGGSHIPSNGSNVVTKRSILEANRRFSSSSSTSSSSNVPSRRPSVTFADDVTGGSRPGSRKPSVEQDSIVTESLLAMTSGGGSDARRFSNASNSSSTTNSRKTSVSSSQSKSQDEHSTTETETAASEQETVDLEAFATSLRKSRPIKPFSNNNNASKSRSQGSSDDLDETSSSSSNPSEAYDSTTTPPNERRSMAGAGTTSLSTSSTTSRIHTNKSHQSAFGGIADHYAAAKEIAKEIESYSNGSAKASSKRSLVRDLLYRGNRNASSSTSTSNNDNATKIGTGNNSSTLVSNTSYGTYNSKNGFRTGRVAGSSIVGVGGTGRDGGTITRETRHHNYPQSSSSLQQPEQQVVLGTQTLSSAAGSFPLYQESGYGIATTANGKNAHINSRRANTANQEVVTTLRRPGSDDWELVRVQQVYVKADGSSIQDHHQYQQQQQQLLQKQRKSNHPGGGKEGDASTISTRNNNDQGQDHSSTITISATTTSARRHPSLLSSTGNATATTSKSKASSSTTTLAATAMASRGNASKKVPPTDDGLVSGARPRKQHNDDPDSGKSNDRIYEEVRLEIEGTAIDIPGDQVLDSSTIQVEDENSNPPENLPSKVMIVTGDSQNIVVDLSGVPHDLKNAIVSGTALITLPDGLDKMLQPGYTMITIPASKSLSTKSQLGGGGDPTQAGPTGGATRNNLSKKDGAMNITIGIEDEKPLVRLGGSSNNSSDDECKLFSTKNKTQIWDVIQNTIGKQHDAGGGGKAKKKITTVFPFHPNQDTYSSPDFTIEGHRLDRQRKRVETEKKRRCACRLCGMLFFLVAFLGVLVALSMIYTKGQRYFGSV